MKMYAVGGSVRDSLMGLVPKDFDYAVEAKSFKAMYSQLQRQGMQIKDANPEYGVVYAKFPFASQVTGTFTLCRRDGTYGDGRHPDYIVPGTIYEDLKRRDFTCNAIAQDCITGEFIDPFGGKQDIECRVLRSIGHPEERFKEDALRVLRAIRFHITRELDPTVEIIRAFLSPYLPERIKQIPIERRREELYKCFRHDSLLTIEAILHLFPFALREAVFGEELWLKPTLEKR